MYEHIHNDQSSVFSSAGLGYTAEEGQPIFREKQEKAVGQCGGEPHDQ